MKPNSITQKDKPRVSTDRIRPNDLMAFIYYGKVSTSIKNNGARGPFAQPDQIQVINIDDGSTFYVQGRELIEKGYSADQYHTERSVTKTELAEILTRSFNTPFTVTFIKADNSERVLRGRLIKTEPLMGRSYAEDLDITEPNKTRLVDHRTIKSLIVDGIKYSVKER